MRSPAREDHPREERVHQGILPGSILRKLSPEEHDAYRAPFREAGEGRRPTLTWPRQIPIAGEPKDVAATAAAYQVWLAASPVPKLFINAEPGSILVGKQREICRRWRNQTEVTVKGSHFIQEDSPDEIGRSVAELSRAPRHDRRAGAMWIGAEDHRGTAAMSEPVVLTATAGGVCTIT